MPESADEKRNTKAAQIKSPQEAAPEDERMEDEEKILAGRHDVNYPALLTKDVPGG